LRRIVDSAHERAGFRNAGGQLTRTAAGIQNPLAHMWGEKVY
jgi:hypothetical protein